MSSSASDTEKQPARPPNVMQGLNGKVNDALENMFEGLGRFVGGHPVLVIIGTLPQTQI